MNFFRRIANLFRRKETPKVEVAPPPVVAAPTMLNYPKVPTTQAEYYELARAQGWLDTSPAEVHSKVIPDQYVGKTMTYEEYLKAKYGQVPVQGRDLTSEEITATATKKDLSLLPDPPSFMFRGNTPGEVKFNEIRASQGQQAAYKHLLSWQWNELGTEFREQALASGISKEDISRIINSYSGAGGGMYFKP